MSHDLPDGSAEQVKEVPASLKAVFEKERHNILGENGLEVTPEDVKEFNGLIAEGSSIEEIRAVRDGFNNQFDQVATEFNDSETLEPRRAELKELMIKLLHKIATGEAVINSKKAEPKGSRYEKKVLATELKNADVELGQVTSSEERDQIRSQVETLKVKQVLNKQKLEAKMVTMDPTDRQRLGELDRQEAGIAGSILDLEKQRGEQERMYKDGMQPEFQAKYDSEMSRLNIERTKVEDEMDGLVTKYNL